jgi:hypothetical protein
MADDTETLRRLVDTRDVIRAIAAAARLLDEHLRGTPAHPILFSASCAGMAIRAIATVASALSSGSTAKTWAMF